MLMQLVITLPIAIITDFKPSDFFNSYNVNISASFIVANLFSIILTIIPMKVSFQGIKIPNDGLSILRIPFMKQKEINVILSAGKIMEAYELYEARKYSDAQLAFEKCMNEFPDSIVAHIDYSATLIKQLKLKEAEKKIVDIKDNKHDKNYDLIIYNNLAWIKLLTFTEESLKEADTFSKKAYEINSDTYYVKGTRGSTLIALEKYDEGIKILNKGIKANKPIDRETNSIVHFYMLAFAYLKKNDKNKTIKFLEVINNNFDKMDDDDKYLFDLLKNSSNDFDGYFSAENGEKKIPDRNIQQRDCRISYH
jgi:tetratricopeptide (TPR) repeat protein